MTENVFAMNTNQDTIAEVVEKMRLFLLFVPWKLNKQKGPHLNITICREVSRQ